MVQAIPWLDWQHHAKGGEVRALGEWLWWLAVQAQQEGVAGVHVTTDQPVVARGGNAGNRPKIPREFREDWW
jgi:hypothetical protein